MIDEVPLVLQVDSQNINDSSDTLQLYYTEHYTPVDSASLVNTRGEAHPGLSGDSMPYRLHTDNGITALLFLCFFLMAYVFFNGKKFLLQQIKDFTYTKDRGNLFSASTAAEVRYRFLLFFQTCILLGIFCFDYFYDHNPKLLDKCSPILVSGVYIGVFVIYYSLKWLLYSFLYWIFFDKNKATAWLESYSTILYYFGFSLFPLILFMVYFDLSSGILLPIGIGLIIFAKILMFYKWLKLFFNNLYGLFCLILYFCALEIMPCFVLYQGLIQINNLLLIKL